MSISPYLFFDGTCREAMTAYANILGGEVLAMMTFGEAPPEEGLPDGIEELIMHTTIKVGDEFLMASDDIPGRNVTPASTHVMLNLTDVGEAKAAFDRLAEGGDVQMDFTETFWAQGFGTLRDKWGTLWMIGVDGPPPNEAD